MYLRGLAQFIDLSLWRVTFSLHNSKNERENPTIHPMRKIRRVEWVMPKGLGLIRFLFSSISLTKTFYKQRECYYTS